MNPLDLITPISAIINKVLDYIPDPQQKLQAQLVAQEQAFELAKAQIAAQDDANANEAKNPSIFVAGGRPFIMWVCGCGIAYTYIVQPFLVCAIRLAQANFTPPTLDTGTLMALVTAMLGISVGHVVENVTATNAGKK